MNEIIERENIENLIYEVRGVQIMLDSDLAKLYCCKNGTKTINQAVNRHKNRFPSDFCFQLSKEEFINLRSQVGTANYRMTRTLPYAFTEEGVSMLSSVIHTEIAESISVKIIRTFVKMRKLISINSIEQKYINNLVLKDHDRIDLLEETFNKLSEKQKVNTLFYDGQVYDAHSLLLDILNESKKEIIIIDNYAGKELLDILRRINKRIVIISSNINEILKNKYEKQYNNVTFINNNTFHDRFIIIDKKILYMCGSSFKDLGKKCFYIGKIESEDLLNNLLNKISIK